MQNKFIITGFTLLLLTGISIVTIIYYLEPNHYIAIGLVLLVGFFVNMLFALIYYFITPIKGLETDRQIFRRGYKKGIFIGLMVIILISSQYFLDIF